jgi:hypothetical protein
MIETTLSIFLLYLNSVSPAVTNFSVECHVQLGHAMVCAKTRWSSCTISHVFSPIECLCVVYLDSCCNLCEAGS